MRKKRMRNTKLVVWNTERLIHSDVPWYGKKTILEHEERYHFAKKYVKSKVVIDLGSGTGYGSYLFAISGAKKIYAIDNDYKAINYAKKNYSHSNIVFLTSDATRTKLKSNLADIIVSFEIIEHLNNPSKFCNEVKRLLKPQGIFILSTPNANTSLSDNPYHIHEFTLEELKKILLQFKIISLFGQRKVSFIIINLYKILSSNIRSQLLRMFFHFRPWENYTIHPLKNSNNSYLYFIALCKKK